jgi:hypothetical protein
MKRIALLLAAALAVGCISIPDDIRSSFDAPDGKRPNNFGVLVEGEVRADQPTIGSAGGAAPVESRS